MAKNASSAAIKPAGKPPTVQARDRSAPWQTRLSKLIKSLLPGADVGSFRRDWSNALADAPAEQTQLLATLPDILEKWLSATPPTPSDAHRQWHGFYESGKDRLPSVVLEEVLRLFPK